MTVSANSALSKKTRRLALASSLLYFIFQLLDILLTYLISPELHRETNIMVARFGYGWGFVLLSAGIASLVMLLALPWVWKNLVQRFPSSKLGYSAFYHHLLFDTKTTSAGHKSLHLRTTIMAVLLILLYSLIAAKLFAVIWNALLLTLDIRLDDFMFYILLKNLLAATIGLYLFFVYLYFLQRLKHLC
jgi:hypothetical protein